MQQSIFQFKEKPDFNCRCEPLRREIRINKFSVTCWLREGDTQNKEARVIESFGFFKKHFYVWKEIGLVQTVVMVQMKRNTNLDKKKEEKNCWHYYFPEQEEIYVFILSSVFRESPHSSPF